MSQPQLKRPHFTYHEINGEPWAECPKHDEIYQECLDSGGFDIKSDCVGCVVEDRIIKLLEAEMCEDWRNKCNNGLCGIFEDAIALIKGETE